MIISLNYLILQDFTLKLNLILDFLFLFESKTYLFGFCCEIMYFLRLILRICWLTVRYLTYTLDLAILTFSNIFLFLSVSVISVASRWESSVNVYCGFKALYFRNFTYILFLIAYHFLNQNFYSLLGFENVDFTNNLFMITYFRE